MDREKQKNNEESLRKKILEINRDSTLSVDEKARRIQDLMTSGYRRSRPSTPDKNHDLNGATLTEADKKVTYQDESLRIMGCKHYRRGNRLQADCCGQWFTCRFCHDEGSDHQIVRQNTKNMLCMYCKTSQPAAQRCAVTTCGQLMSRYYCDKCKLWDDDSSKNIYHCDDCGICRVGKGLGYDYFHCDKCNICMMITLKDNHRCIERNLESDCPICGEYMFTSTSTVIFMPCGHCIHDKCHSEYVKTSYQCPTCLKSLGDMTEHFNRIDAILARERMPDEYENYISNIVCNDCERKSQCPYHFIYNKCVHCGSYNTAVLSTIQRDTGTSLPLSLSESATNFTSPFSNGDDEDDCGASANSTVETVTNVTAPTTTTRSRPSSETPSWVSFFSAFGSGE